MGQEIKIIIADDNRNLCQMLQKYIAEIFLTFNG